MSEHESVSEPSDQSATDRVISEVLRTIPCPEPKNGLEKRVRHRLRERRVRRLALAGSITVLVLCAGRLLWQPTRSATRLAQPTQSRPPSLLPSALVSGSMDQQAFAMLNASEIDVLFALPPVDPLRVLDQRQQMAFSILED